MSFSGQGNKRTRYTGQEVEFFHFMHSICLLGRLMVYSGGADLFPVQTKNGNGKYMYLTWGRFH